MKFLYALVIVFLMVGCSVGSKRPIDSQVSTLANEKLSASTSQVEKSLVSSDSVDAGAKNIIVNTDTLESNLAAFNEKIAAAPAPFAFDAAFVKEYSSTTSALTKQIKLDANTIITENRIIKTNLLTVQENLASLLDVVPKIKDYESQLSDLNVEKQKIENQAKKDTLNTYIAFGVLGMITLLVGAFISFKDQKLGLKILAVGGISMVVSLIVIQTFADWRWIGLGVIALSIVATIYMLVRKFIILKKANTENMKVIETIKPLLPEEQKTVLFEKGIEGVPAIHALQSETTIKEFQEFKKKEIGNTPI